MARIRIKRLTQEDLVQGSSSLTRTSETPQCDRPAYIKRCSRIENLPMNSVVGRYRVRVSTACRRSGG